MSDHHHDENHDYNHASHSAAHNHSTTEIVKEQAKLIFLDLFEQKFYQKVEARNEKKIQDALEAFKKEQGDQLLEMFVTDNTHKVSHMTVMAQIGNMKSRI